MIGSIYGGTGRRLGTTGSGYWDMIYLNHVGTNRGIQPKKKGTMHGGCQESTRGTTDQCLSQDLYQVKSQGLRRNLYEGSLRFTCTASAF